MPTLQELKSQIAELQQQAAELHAKESADAIATVKELISQFSLTAEQVGLGPSRKRARNAPAKSAAKSARPGAGIPKYADPESGKTWTGFGKPPGWIAGAPDRSAFLIASGDKPAAAARKAASKKATRSKKA